MERRANIPLSKQALHLGGEHLDSFNYDQHCKICQKIWWKYKCKLIFDFSPVASFLMYSQLQAAAQYPNFEHWK